MKINMNNEKHQVKEIMYCIVMCLIEKAVKAKMNDTINVLSYGYAYIEINRVDEVKSFILLKNIVITSLSMLHAFTRETIFFFLSVHFSAK